MLEVWILPSPQVVLITTEVRFLVDHEAAALHADGVAATDEAAQVGTVIRARVPTSREVVVLVEDNLQLERILEFSK